MKQTLPTLITQTSDDDNNQIKCEPEFILSKRKHNNNKCDIPATKKHKCYLLRYNGIIL